MAASIVFNPRWQLIDGDGAPYPNALLYTYAAGTSTPLPVYSDVDLEIAHTNPVEADADGRFPLMFMSPTGYKLVAADEDDVEVWSADNYSDPGTVFSENFGTVMAQGSRNVTSGYTLLATDRTVTVASSGASVFNLLAASAFTMDVVVKNMLTGTVVLTPNGSDTIDGLSTYTIAAAASPKFPCVTLRPITGGWLIVASHGVG